MSKVKEYAQNHVRNTIGLGLDSAESVTVFIAVVPGANVIMDLPCIQKSTLPDAGNMEPPKKKPATMGNTLDELLAPCGRIKKTKPKTKRGFRSIELLRMMCQQLSLLFNVPISHFLSRMQWSDMAGPPPMTRPLLDDAPSQPNTLTITSDQGGEILMAAQLARWIGLRVVHFPDHNHRDNNDSVTLNPSLSMSLELLVKVTNGPFGRATWFKSILETIICLEEDETACSK